MDMGNIESLQTSLEEDILVVTLNTSSPVNALTEQSLYDLQKTIQDDVYDNETIKGAIITGEGEDAFATGTNAKELIKLHELNARKFAENGQDTCNLIENCPKPIIAAISGYALGGGCELALACHFRLASDNAIFGFPDIVFGIIPGFGGTQRLTKLIGRTKALELLMTGRCITAEEAEELGLVSDVVSYKEEMLKKGREWINKIMGNEPLAVSMLVSCVNAAHNPDEDGYQTEANCFANCFKTPYFKDNLTKFLHSTPPYLQKG